MGPFSIYAQGLLTESEVIVIARIVLYSTAYKYSNSAQDRFTTPVDNNFESKFARKARKENIECRMTEKLILINTDELLNILS